MAPASPPSPVADLRRFLERMESHGRLTGAVLPPGILQYVRSNEIKLAGLDLPSGLDAQTAALLRASISHAFVFGFRIAMLICASLCVASAAVAALMIPTKTDHLI